MNERISEEVLREKRVRPPVHPGRVLELEFLKPLGITAYQLAKAIGVMPPRVYEIVHGERAVSADTALRLGRYFGTGPEFWINLQSHYDLEVARDRAGEKIEREVRPLSPA
jgi:addiction module HigA family antidote